MSTPQKKGPINIPILQHTRANVDGPMKQEMEGHIQVVELEKLIKVSFGLTDEEVAVIKSATWTLPQKPLKNYKLKVRAGSHECHRYPHIQAILEGVVTQLEHPKPGFDLRGGNHSGAAFYVEMDGNHRLKAQGVSRGPDGWMGWTRPSTLTWNSIKAALEIKVTRGEGVRQGLPREHRSVSTSQTTSHPSSMAPIRSLASTSAAAYASTTMASTTTVASTGEKRRRDDADDPQESHQSNKKACVEEPNQGLSNKTVQLALYAMECLANGCRRWTFGLLIDNYTVTLWHFDRMGALRSQPFEFHVQTETWKLALILAGLYRCTPAQAGFEPLIVSPGATINTQTNWPLFDRPLSTLKDAEIVVPRSILQLAASDKRYRVDNNKLLYTYRGIIGRGTTVIPVRPLPSTGHNDNCLMVAKISCPSLARRVLESTLTRRLRQSLGYMRKHLPKIIQARVFSLMHMNFPRFSFGNLVDEHRQFTLIIMRRYRPLWEITSLEDFKNVFVDLVECHYHAFKAGHVLHRDISENNLMWTIEAEGDFDEDGDEVYNTFSAECEGRDWEDERRVAEEGDVEEASMDTQSKDQDSKDGGYGDDETDDRDSKDGEHGDDEIDDQDSKDGEHGDDEIDDEDISQLNYDLKETLPAADTASGLIPKPNNVSAPSENASSRKTAAQPKKKGGKAIGILGDWDLGSPVQDDGTVDRSTANHRTGTLPFMARDLLDDDPPPHLYRHDLESFFYVLIWAMVHYDLKGARRCTKDGSTHPIISDWESHVDANRKGKGAIIGHRQDLRLIIKCVQAPFKPLIREWVRPLWNMFNSGTVARNAHEDSDECTESSSPPISPSPSGRVDESSASPAVPEGPAFDAKTLGGHVTFEAFMRAINRTPRAPPSKSSNIGDRSLPNIDINAEGKTSEMGTI